MTSRESTPRDRAERVSFEHAWHDRFVKFAELRDDDAGIAGWSTSGLETRFRFFRGLWPATPPGALYLDAGCGAGTYTRWLTGQGMRVVGIDYSLPALAKARDRSGSAAMFCGADAVHLPFGDATFDAALCFGLLQAVSDSTPVVRELARVLKPGAALWIDALNRGGVAARAARARLRLRHRPMHLRYESPRILGSILADAGFENLARHWLPIMPSRLQRLQPLVESRFARSALATIAPMGAFLSHAFVYCATRAHRPPLRSET